jgi:thymidine kinase
VGKPTIKEIEEYMAALNIPMEQQFNGTTSYDIISKPKHYMLFDEADLFDKNSIEVRDVLEKLCDKLQNTLPYPGNSSLFESDYVQLMQYLMRFMDKNGVEDLKKARWYLDKMISAY